MNGSRFGPRRLVMGAAILTLAAIVVSGCGRPHQSSRAQFTPVTGVVRDEAGAPLQGAQVMIIDQSPGAVLGTRNYFGYRGPFVTDASGRFVIPDVEYQPGDPVVLNLVASRSGSLAAYGSNVPSTSLIVGGTRLEGGVRTRDVVVVDSPLNNVIFALPTLGPTQTVGPDGAEFLVPIEHIGGIELPDPLYATVTVPAGAVSTDVQMTVTPLGPDAVVDVGVSMPITVPTTVGATAPSATIVSATQEAETQFDVTSSLSAVHITVRVGGQVVDDYVFPADKRPTVALPLPYPLPAGTSVPILRFGDGTATRARQAGGTGLGVWYLFGYGRVQGLNRPGTFVLFEADRPGTYSSVMAIRWWLSNGVVSESPAKTVDLHPYSACPNGYLSDALFSHLDFSELNAVAGAEDEIGYLRAALAAVTGKTTDGPTEIFVPGNRGVHCTEYKRTAIATLRDWSNNVWATRTGTWRYWQTQLADMTILGEIPPDFAGHVQGGGFEPR